MQVRAGGCLCGAVRYEVRGEPFFIGLCHCSDCRKATGAHAMPSATWRRDALTITGKLATYAGRSFCPVCGSRVMHLQPERAEIMLGSLDDPPVGLKPQHEIWTVRREAWATPIDGAEQFPQDPE